MKRLLFMVCALLVLVGCESLEDTYDDMDGDGKIRYIGMCKNIAVVPGWERLTVSWENQIDPVITNINVAWISDGVRKDTLLPRSAISCDIKHLANSIYEVVVCSVDKNGNKSMEINTYGRPYTMEHEIVNSFSRVVTKHFFIKDRLVLFFDKWNDNLQSVELSYTLADGEKRTMALTERLVSQKYYLLPDAINPNDTVKVFRKGYIDNSTDLIPFKEIVLGHDYLFTTDFKHLCQYRYGLQEVNQAFVEGLKVLEIDYSLNSLEDILYFPNLQKLYLGKNRYMLEKYATGSGEDNYYCGNNSKIIDDVNLEKTTFILNTMNELVGLKVDRYNEHFIPRRLASKFTYLTEMGNPVIPERQFMTQEKDKFTVKWNYKDEDINVYDSHLEYLFDGNLSTAWNPSQVTTPRTHEIMVDFVVPKKVNGVQVVQRTFNPKSESNYLKFIVSVITVQGSNDGVIWTDLTNVEDIILGATIGEVTELKFREDAGAIRFLRFKVNDLPLGANYSISLADLRMY